MIRAVGLCQCGCGQQTAIAKTSDIRTGTVKGQPRRFASGHSLRFRREAGRELTEPERAWLAGVIDAEGSIMLTNKEGRNHNRRYLRAKIKVSNTHEGFVRRCHEVSGLGIVHTRHREERSAGHWSDLWWWECGAWGCRILLPQILTWLVIKDEQARTVLEYLRLAEERLSAPGQAPTAIDWAPFHQRMRELNRKRSIALEAT